MTSKLELDTRLDPRIKKYFAGMPLGAEKPNVSSREELLTQENWTTRYRPRTKYQVSRIACHPTRRRLEGTTPTVG
jgi:hypothetical protein